MAVDIEIFRRTVFPWFTNPHGPNRLFELWIHPVGYGLLLAPFFFGLGRRAPVPLTSRADTAPTSADRPSCATPTALPSATTRSPRKPR